jgi:hypothetical protein
MLDSSQPFYIFEHPNFSDIHDALRQSRLYGFRYRAEHIKYAALSEALLRQVPAHVLGAALAIPLEKVPDNSALYILRLTACGREQLLPILLAEALALGFCVFDDHLGRCHTVSGLWTIEGFCPAPLP